MDRHHGRAVGDAQWKATFKREVTDGSLDEVTVVSQNEAVVTNNSKSLSR